MNVCVSAHTDKLRMSWVSVSEASFLFRRLRLQLNRFAFQMSDDGGKGRKPTDESMIVFLEKMEWKERKGARKERWRLLSIIKLPHSPDRGNSEALSLCWSIPLLWEDGQHNKLSVSQSISSFLSVFCFFFYLSVCHLVSTRMFSQIIDFRCTSPMQCTNYHESSYIYNPSQIECRVQFKASDKSKIWCGVLSFE